MARARSIEDFAVAKPSRASWLVLLAIWAALVAVNLALPHRQSPTNPVPWQVVVFFGCALVVVGPFVWLQRRRIAIEDGTLVVGAALYTRKLPIAALDVDRARIVDLDERTELKPLLGLGSTGLPGFRGGHYLLRDRGRAFCLLTDLRHVLVLPTRDGRRLLLSPEQPQALLSRLRDLATRADSP